MKLLKKSIYDVFVRKTVTNKNNIYFNNFLLTSLNNKLDLLQNRTNTVAKWSTSGYPKLQKKNTPQIF